jgi:lipoprotein-anchoring transpeptidase ErfK/SrfK
VSEHHRSARRSLTSVVVATLMLGIGQLALAGSTAILDTTRPGVTDPWGGQPPVAIASSATAGYWVVSGDGAVFAYDGALYAGGANTNRLAAPIVDIAGTPTAQGYWLLGADGGVFNYGDAGFLGSAPELTDVSAMAPTPTGQGYWVVTVEGVVQAFGDAADLRATYPNAADPNADVVDIVASPTGRGYTLVWADGTTAAFGDAAVLGSIRSAVPIVSAVASGVAGLWLIDSVGTVTSLGTAAQRSPIAGTDRIVRDAISNRTDTGFQVIVESKDVATPTAGAGTAVGAAAGTGPTSALGPSPATHGLGVLPAASGNGRRVVYSNSGQQAWLVDEAGTVVRTFRVSGRRGVPRAGVYSVRSKSPVAFASSSRYVSMRNMTRFVGGIGFHEIPRKSGRPLQGLDELGQFRSHGCVRLAAEDAVFVYEWATVGTPVVVLA